MSDGEFQIVEDEMDSFIPGNYFQGGKNIHHQVKTKPMTGIELIEQKRLNHKVKHGKSVKYDAENNIGGELVQAAQALIEGNIGWMPEEWDNTMCNQMIREPYLDRLIAAGALIAAEIDRLNYKP